MKRVVFVPYELASFWAGTGAAPKIVGVRTLAGTEIGVRVGALSVARLPDETVVQMVHRAAALHGTREPFTLLYEGVQT